jgi:hypothetical protein
MLDFTALDLAVHQRQWTVVKILHELKVPGCTDKVCDVPFVQPSTRVSYRRSIERARVLVTADPLKEHACSLPPIH